MASTVEARDQDPDLEEELGPITTPSDTADLDPIMQSRKRPTKDAFSELMSKKAKTTSSTSKKSTKIPSTSTTFFGRDGLGAYTADPTAFGPDVVVYHNDDFVVIHDKFPKSSVHLLILPRDPSKQLLHPITAFQDTEFLDKTKKEVEKVKAIVASELRRKYGKYSAQDKVRNDAMEDDVFPEELPAGRDWEVSVKTGFHMHPSMNHLHIHVLSVDRYSEPLKTRTHYNSFATPFLVTLDEMPLVDQGRLNESYLKWDMKCWRCGKNFGNKFVALKDHLEQEFKKWRAE